MGCSTQETLDLQETSSIFSLGSTSPQTALAASSPSRRDASQEDFSSTLARVSGRTQTPEEQARAAAEQFVSVALIQPLLSQLRGSNQAAPPFAPTQGEKQFQSMFDASIAQQITRAKRFPLVDRLTDDLLKRVRGRQSGAETQSPESDGSGSTEAKHS